MLEQLPVWWANVISVILFVLIAGACWLIPKSTIFKDAPDQARWRDIRWWSLALVIVQLGIYAVFT